MTTTPKYDRYTVQFKGVQTGFAVYGWGTYARNSVLAGQPMKVFIDSFDTQAEALEAYPQAASSNRWLDPHVSLAHLPDENDQRPGGAWPDDYDDGI